MSEKKKSLFDKAIDALTDREKKEAAEKTARAKTTAERTAVAKTAEEKATDGNDERVEEARATIKRIAEKKAAAAAAPQKGTVIVRSLRIRADHSTASEVVGGLLNGDKVTVLSTWSDGKDTWAQLDKGWAAMVYDGETYIKLE